MNCDFVVPVPKSAARPDDAQNRAARRARAGPCRAEMPAAAQEAAPSLDVRKEFLAARWRRPGKLILVSVPDRRATEDSPKAPRPHHSPSCCTVLQELPCHTDLRQNACAPGTARPAQPASRPRKTVRARPSPSPRSAGSSPPLCAESARPPPLPPVAAAICPTI
jgi:hypothetical protein